MKIALFGGSFDPPHKGHNAVIKEALNSLDIDKLIIMPSFLSPFKKGFCADEQRRFTWVKTLWGNLEKIEISDYEIQQKRAVPSFETVKYLYRVYKPGAVYLIVGADHLQTLHLWQNFEELNSLVEFVIANRDGIVIPKVFRSLSTKINISSSFIRTALDSNEVCEEIKDEVRDYYTKLQKNNIISSI
ncbi:nicotinate (nicotinamide) nucleotide adenylyltransferase [Campylobacter sp. MIT 21-1685]|uniref:nicotinate (nicotinamide) nucleotide adenylyltransferase n=1 Tax=unclassified Campylobacter TaxID=2593542 RepID=UPI00224B3920|nr:MULTISPECIES: nicotinate (nicotinamide) nucleotide adenylyltransferase [unclassified Campylobacter]MCX2683280.1 nicotinate (nicotinamide) nucleotide adenylyltransferase [Campylobacter sp. MIT 21-1684]MCX2751527.1 nicotinate (nicotinamide) nucleotide adenylyltransferase [Campylobacter sp. MIT 21-1682]MCX2807726.1 nicotinate (nicotinamide) nucleotide adenylyltransferase [Campylobacter sp. MIT 21-1685]